MRSGDGIIAVLFTIGLLFFITAFWFFVIPYFFGTIEPTMQLLLYGGSVLVMIAVIILYIRDVEVEE